MVTDFFVICVFSLYSSDFSIANCSAGLFVQLSFSVYFKLLVGCLICIRLSLHLTPVPIYCHQWIFVLCCSPRYYHEGCLSLQRGAVSFFPIYWSIFTSYFLLLLVSWYSWAVFSIFMSMGVKHVIKHRASFETVRLALASLMLISFWTGNLQFVASLVDCIYPNWSSVQEKG